MARLLVQGQRITEALTRGSAIEILALPDNGLLHYGGFHLNLAAALEDDIIRKLDPIWNGGKTEKTQYVLPVEDDEQIPDDVTDAFSETFRFILQPTYLRTGFFNVGVSAQKYLGADGEMIEMFLGNASQPVLGTINRRANSNGTPRIIGGTALRDWFKTHAREMDAIAIQVLSPTSIRLETNVS